MYNRDSKFERRDQYGRQRATTGQLELTIPEWPADPQTEMIQLPAFSPPWSASVADPSSTLRATDWDEISGLSYNTPAAGSHSHQDDPTITGNPSHQDDPSIAGNPSRQDDQIPVRSPDFLQFTDHAIPSYLSSLPARSRGFWEQDYMLPTVKETVSPAHTPVTTRSEIGDNLFSVNPFLDPPFFGTAHTENLSHLDNE